MHLVASVLSGSERALNAAALDDGGLVAGELVEGEEVADFLLDQLEQLGIVDEVDLVEENEDGGNADLAGKEDVLAGLGHDRVGGGDDEHRAVHLGRAGDHVLDVVGVAGAVDMRIVALLGLVLEVPGVDRDAAGLLFGRIVDIVELHRLIAELARAVLGDCGAERRLSMVDVTDRTDVHMRFGALELLFGHIKLLLGFVPPIAIPGELPDYIGESRANQGADQLRHGS